MHGDIDPFFKQGFLDLFCEQPFAAFVRQRSILDRIAGRANNQEFNLLLVDTRGRS